METRRVVQVDAFADEPMSGNPAGVVPDADGLSAAQMQAIARELAVSETAFLLESDDPEADRRIRYFTPTTEVDACGHATVGAFAHLHDEGREPGTTTLETNAGRLAVDLEADGTVWLTYAAPTVREAEVDGERVASALGVDAAAIEGTSADLPLSVATAGLSYLVVPITYLSDVGEADPDADAVADLADAVDATGVYLFTFDTLAAESTVHGRMFAPGAGIPEDPVTGTASGAVSAFLTHHGAFDGDRESFRLEQGHYVDRPGVVRTRLADGDVRVGGRGVAVLDGTVVVPDDEDGDILEA